MANLFMRSCATGLLLLQIYATLGDALSCKDCMTAKAPLIITCNKTDLCAGNVTPNCTLKTNCSAIVSTATESLKTHYFTMIPASVNSTASTSPSVSTSMHSASVTPTPTPKPTKPASKKPTEGPHPQPPKRRRKFDTASFIGGILLCGGIILLVYIAVRCYKSKPNYSRL